MPWIVYIADSGQEPEEIARASDRARAEAFAEIAQDLAKRDTMPREVLLRWEDEPGLTRHQTVYQDKR